MATYAAKLDRVSSTNLVDNIVRSGLTTADIAVGIVGTTFYVDSTNGAAGADGLGWDRALATVDQAVAKCTANSGDVILMAPWHAETEAGEDTSIWTMSKAGVSLVGVKQGRQMPTFTFTDDGAVASVTGANCVIQNCKFVSGVIDLASALTLGALADGTTVDGCHFFDGSAVLEMVLSITITAACADVTVSNCLFRTTPAGSGTLAGIFAAGAADRLWIANNVFSGDWNTQGPIDLSTAASLDIFIADNTIYNLDAATGYGVDCHASTTGSIVRNLIFAGKNTQAAVVAAGCLVCENYQTTVEAESGNLVPATGDWAA